MVGWASVAPSTFLIPISRVLREVVIAANPKSPMQEINMANPAMMETVWQPNTVPLFDNCLAGCDAQMCAHNSVVALITDKTGFEPRAHVVIRMN